MSDTCLYKRTLGKSGRQRRGLKPSRDSLILYFTDHGVPLNETKLSKDPKEKDIINDWLGTAGSLVPVAIHHGPTDKGNYPIIAD